MDGGCVETLVKMFAWMCELFPLHWNIHMVEFYYHAMLLTIWLNLVCREMLWPTNKNAKYEYNLVTNPYSKER